MTLKRITTRYIQSHREITVELPEKGLIGFYGDNSNGKSVIVRVTEDIIKNNITKPKCRLSLVNRDSGLGYGEVEYERYDGMILRVHIHKEAAQTWFELKRPGSEDLNRAYLSSKLLPTYVEEFGFHYLPSRDMTLNICDGDDSVLFFNTPHKLNFEVLDSALNDVTAQRSLDSMTKVLKSAQSTKQTMSQQLEICNTAISGIKLWDIEQETRVRDKLTYLLKNLENIYIPHLVELPKLPDIQFINLKRPQLSDLKFPEIIDIHKPQLMDVTELARELESIRNGVCPTCGHHFKEDLV